MNYSTRVLGRRGYVSMNLVVDPAGFTDSRPHMIPLLVVVGGFVSKLFGGKKTE